MIERDYNRESADNIGSKYGYSFDYDVMHKYMLKSFMPFVKKGNALELGCFQGAFTQRLEKVFSDLTCVEASDVAIRIAEKKVNSEHVKFVNALFEEAELGQKYDNIFLTHVLEHLDERVNVLKKIKEEWLSDEGVLFIACPNANAASRQIAVKMDLIEHNTAVTESERAHGHRITYTLDTLEREIKQANLHINYFSGIFFKALANFQWDRLLKTDIISEDYLEGCYELGKKYPDLCSSIYFVCTK